jgi:glutamate-ammonia-ligase adenylyltransferase
MRKLQHQLRLQGQDQSRVDPSRVERHAAQVSALWRSMFGDAESQQSS